MSTPRILLFGAGGQVGQALRAQEIPTNWDLYALTRAECDIINPQSLRHAVQNTRPDLIINAAGMTNVDQCEQDNDAAMDANFHAVANMAAQCCSLDIPLIHLSTDYVFDGRERRPYSTEDQMNPINNYGASKWLGEEALRHGLAWHVILRISSVFSAFSRNILTNTLKMIDERDELRMVGDMVSAPTPATHVAQAIISIAGQILEGKAAAFGTFQLCGTPACSRYELTQAIMAAYAPYTDRRPVISEVTSDVYVNLAPRPLYSVMECSKIKETFGIAQRPWQEGLDEAMYALFKDKPRQDALLLGTTA